MPSIIPEIAGWLLLAVHVWLLFRIVTVKGKEPAARAAWILAILFLPLLGLIGYLFLGEPRLGQSARLRARSASLQLLALRTLAEGKSSGPIPRIAPPYRAAFSYCMSVSGMAASTGNHGMLAPDSNRAIAAIVADIDAARHHVHVSFYIWLDDHNGRSVAAALCRAARRGIICRVIIDAIGSRAFLRSVSHKQMQEAGVRTVCALAPPRGLGLVWGNRVDVRTHRKIVVIDHAITHFGSQNCADPEFRVKARFAPWVDIMVRLTGPVAQQNQALFLGDWLAETGEQLDMAGLDIAAQDTAELDGAGAETPPAQTGQAITAVAFGTGVLTAQGAMSGAFVAVIYTAQRELVISTPYFAPDQPLLAALTCAARRGVAVSLVLPARNDSWIVGRMSRGYYPALLEAGIRVFEFSGGLLHAKTMVADRHLCLIGSANMDRRSLELNFENNVLLASDSFGRAVRDRQDSYLASSVEILPADVDRRRTRTRVIDNILGMFSPIF